MIRAGTPVIYGMQSTAVDMRNAQYACAAPEGTLMQGFGARMARFYKLPSRGGGCLTDAPLVNAQAGYESMMTFYSAWRNGINLILEAGGVLTSVKATSFDKMLSDFEILRLVKRCFAPVMVNEETLNLSDIREIGHDGEFLTSEHTLEHCRDLFTPRIGTRWRLDPAYFNENLDQEYDRLMKLFEEERPELDREKLDKVKEVLHNISGIPLNQLERIDQLV